jgi:predicted CXXCH cytochrome family protein
MNIIRLILIVGSIVWGSTWAEAITRRPAKECRLCHVLWFDALQTDNKNLLPSAESPVVIDGSTGLASTQRMCDSCHDGYIVDSRVRIISENPHHQLKKPPDWLQLPDGFRLDINNEIYCGTCHTLHDISGGETVGSTPFLRMENEQSQMCIVCHTGKTEDKDKKNHPVLKPLKELPFREIADQDIKLGPQQKIVCQTCHKPHGVNAMAGTLANSDLCRTCHRQGIGKYSHPVNIDLPAGTKAAGRLPLFNTASGKAKAGRVQCFTCHDPHGGPPDIGKETSQPGSNEAHSNPFLLRKPPATICGQCHQNKYSLIDSKHDLRKTLPEATNINQKRPADSGPCGGCHVPHKAAGKKLWARSIESQSFGAQACLACHDPLNVYAIPTVVDKSHPINVKLTNRLSKTNTLPLFNPDGTQHPDGQVQCFTCHDPHGRFESSGRLPDKREKGNPDLLPLFLRSFPEQICRECHQEKYFIAQSKHDMGKTAPESKNNRNQTPSESGICGSCHQVHSGMDAFLWGRKLETSNKNPAQNICTSCHNQKGLAHKKVIRDYSHPIHVSPYARGLTTTLPLFDKNGKLKDQGTMECATCHDPHRWDPAKPILSDHHTDEGNALNSFLRRANMPSPKLCIDCHPQKAYIDQTDHDLRLTAPMAKNIIGQVPAESGICGVCHLVHNSDNWVRLWAQGFGRSDSLMGMMCNGCHSGNGVAKNKIPQVSSHPSGKILSNAGRNTKGKVDFFPLFNYIYGEPITKGNFSCPSCHDVHQWEAGIHTKGRGVNIEGDVTNSFLRSRSTLLPCKDCHGKDALFRYLYFHTPSKRKNNFSVFRKTANGPTF